MTLSAASGIQVIRSLLELCLLTNSPLLAGFRHAEQLIHAPEQQQAAVWNAAADDMADHLNDVSREHCMRHSTQMGPL